MLRFELLIVIAFIVSTCPKIGLAAHIEPRIALIIGNSDYSDEGFPTLEAPVNDADKMAQVLKDYGFDIIRGNNRNTTLKQMRQLLVALKKRLSNQKGGVVFFYYSGHGERLPVSDEKGQRQMQFLAPVDGEPGKTTKLLSISDVLSTVQVRMPSDEIPASIVVIDACRDATKSARIVRQGDLKELEAPQHTLVAYATSEGAQAYSGRKLSRYTMCLENTLRSPKYATGSVRALFGRAQDCVHEKWGDAQFATFNDKLAREFFFSTKDNPDLRITERSAAIERDGAAAPPSAYLDRAIAHMDNIEQNQRPSCELAQRDLANAEHQALTLPIPDLKFAIAARQQGTQRLLRLCPKLSQIALDCPRGVGSIVLKNENGVMHRVACTDEAAVVIPGAYTYSGEGTRMIITSQMVKSKTVTHQYTDSKGRRQTSTTEVLVPLVAGETVRIRPRERFFTFFPLIAQVGLSFGGRIANASQWTSIAAGFSGSLGAKVRLAKRSALGLSAQVQWTGGGYGGITCEGSSGQPPPPDCKPKPPDFAFEDLSIGGVLGHTWIFSAAGFALVSDLRISGSRVTLLQEGVLQQESWLPEYGVRIGIGVFSLFSASLFVSRTEGRLARDRIDAGAWTLGLNVGMGLP